MKFRREAAKRVFAKEFNASKYKIGGEGEKEAVYVLTPLGLKCNRLFIIGALIEKEEIKPDSEMWRIRVADPTGSFLGFIGKFQPEALDSITEISVPSTVAITAKAKLFERGERAIPLLRPETINVSDFDARDYWIVETAKATLRRIKMMESGENEFRIAREKYNPDLQEYKKMVAEVILKLKGEIEVLESEKEEVSEDVERFEEILENHSIEEEILELKDLD
ncbi:MAG: hypothetical protein QXN34_04730 [Archaeoglobaceae archaeon]